MTDVMAILIVDVHPSKAKLTLFLDGDCFLIASTVSAYSIPGMMVTGLAVSTTHSLQNALYDCRSSMFDIAYHGIGAKGNHNMR